MKNNTQDVISKEAAKERPLGGEVSQVERVASALKELGHPIRLTIFKLLVKAGYSGLPVGDLQENLGIPHSTLSHHIAKLLSVDLIRQQREGRTLYCIPQYESLNNLIHFLQDECCMGESCDTGS